MSRGASGTDTGTLTYYDTGKGVVLKSIRRAHKGPITCLALDANFLYTGGTVACGVLGMVLGNVVAYVSC